MGKKRNYNNRNKSNTSSSNVKTENTTNNLNSGNRQAGIPPPPALALYPSHLRIDAGHPNIIWKKYFFLKYILFVEQVHNVYVGIVLSKKIA